MLWRAMAVVLTLMLAACAAPVDEVPTATMAEPGVRFTLTPVPQASCDPASPFVVTVAWEVADMDDPKFDIRLDSTQGQIFARENRAKGESESGDWAREGQWFVLLDRGTQRVLATAQVPPLVCP
jgi:hypothetical protein